MIRTVCFLRSATFASLALFFCSCASDDAAPTLGAKADEPSHGDAGVVEPPRDASTQPLSDAGGGSAQSLPDASRDLPTAAQLQARCDQNDYAACSELGLLYDRGERGVPYDAAMAVALYTKSCDGDFPRGCFNLGLSYFNGEGVPLDQKRAAELFRKACDGGDLGGCTNLGIQYETGKGVAEDKARAVALYDQACKLGGATACSNLAMFYRHGVVVPMDFVRARELELWACSHGEVQGCYNFGVMCIEGQGAPVDRAMAAQYFKMACDRGMKAACNNLDAYGLR